MPVATDVGKDVDQDGLWFMARKLISALRSQGPALVVAFP
jgi:hypothetical protein